MTSCTLVAGSPSPSYAGEGTYTPGLLNGVP